MYAGLKITDKTALLDAKARGFNTAVIKSTMQIVDIDLALAQIAEMETAQTPTIAPLTWNERINQMTAEEKAPYFVYEDTLIDWEDDYNGESTSTETPIYRSSLASDMFFYVEQDAINATVELLDSPYTEGVTK